MSQVSHFVDTRFNCHWTTPATHQQPLHVDSTHQSALSVPLYWRNDGSWPHWHLGRPWHHAVWRGCSQSHAHPTCHHAEYSPHDSGCVSGNESLPQVPAKRERREKETCITEMTYCAYTYMCIYTATLRLLDVMKVFHRYLQREREERKRCVQLKWPAVHMCISTATLRLLDNVPMS